MPVGEPAPVIEQVGDDARIVLVPVLLGDGGFEIGPRRLPAGAGHLVAIAVVAVFEQIVDADGPVAVVVVVRLPQAAEGIDGQFVVVAEVVGEDLEAAAVQLATKGHAAVKRLPFVDDRATENILHNVAVAIVDRVPFVAEVPVEPSVGAEDEFVGRVVVLRNAGFREEDFLLVGLAVAVGVGEDEDVGRNGDDDPVAEHADAHGRVDIASLVEDGRLVGFAVAVGVFQDQDAIALGALAVAMAIVDDLADPHAAAGIDVNIGGAEHHRLRGEERGLQPGADVEPG